MAANCQHGRQPRHRQSSCSIQGRAPCSNWLLLYCDVVCMALSYHFSLSVFSFLFCFLSACFFPIGILPAKKCLSPTPNYIWSCCAFLQFNFNLTETEPIQTKKILFQQTVIDDDHAVQSSHHRLSPMRSCFQFYLKWWLFFIFLSECVGHSDNLVTNTK